MTTKNFYHHFLYFAVLFVVLAGALVPVEAQVVSFGSSGLDVGSTPINNPTSLQFGPDGRLYLSQQDGIIWAFDIIRNGPNDYEAVDVEQINIVKDNIPNYNDDGTYFNKGVKRQVTGLYVAGTASNPILYVSSSDYRIGGGSSGADKDLDTNSSVLSRLTWNGSSWTHILLIRGLPRSEENHAINGLALEASSNTLYMTIGGFTNAGSPSNNFAFITEYAYSGTIVSVDLDAIEALPTQTQTEHGLTINYKYDMPTLDDPTRPNVNGIIDPSNVNYNGIDVGDPFGGNDGLNQAKVVSTSPVQIYSPGWRNPYDLWITESGRMYSIDNGANPGWGGYPEFEGETNCTNKWLVGEPGSSGTGPPPAPLEPKVNNLDNLHYVTGANFYAGHPVPVRGNPAGAGLFTHNSSSGGGSGVFRTAILPVNDPNFATNSLPVDWPPYPVSSANPVECDFLMPGVNDGALATWPASTNGITEYVASNFSGVYQGDLLTASFDGKLYRFDLNEAGDGGTLSEFASGFGATPLDVIAQGDDDIFPGTVWSATYGADSITVFEPADYDGGSFFCIGNDDNTIDEDADQYTNADEIDNGTDPCSGASKPNDFDQTDDGSGFLVSDLNDPDDDNDTLLDTYDPFAIDSGNGQGTTVPLELELFNGFPGYGFYGLGFTGLVTNGTPSSPGTDYLQLFDDNEIIAGGTAGLLTMLGDDGNTYDDNLLYGFQFGLNTDDLNLPYTVEVILSAPFFPASGGTLSDKYEGFYIGDGTQDNFLALVMDANGNIRTIHEEGGSVIGASSQTYPEGIDIDSVASVTLNLTINPDTHQAIISYAVDGGSITMVGSTINLGGNLQSVIDNNYAVNGVPVKMAIGLIATSHASQDFSATWDNIKVDYAQITEMGDWEIMSSSVGSPQARHETGFVESGGLMYLIGGRGTRNVGIYDPVADSWTSGATPPVMMHHIQPVAIDGLIYVVAGYSGFCCEAGETGLDNVYIYDPIANSWLLGAEIPEARRRGSVGTVVYNGEIYIVGGLEGGHGPTATSFSYFDKFNPKTNTWTTLANAPRNRDHFNAVVINDKLYLAGGRHTDTAGYFNNTIEEVDVYDFLTNEWSTLPSGSNIPTERAGTGTAALGNEVVVVGGEGFGQTFDDTEALNVTTLQWRTLDSLNTARHSGGLATCNNTLYLAAGNSSQGGGDELNSLERFSLYSPTTCTRNDYIAGTLVPDPTTLDFGFVSSGTYLSQSIEFTNNVGTQALLIQSATLTGNNDFTYDLPYDLPFVLGAGESVLVDILYTPGEDEIASGVFSLKATNGSPVSVNLIGNTEGNGSDPIYRVNAGDIEVTASPINWAQDNPTQIYSTGGGTSGTGSPTVNTTNAPDIIFERERFGTMQWDFPVESGTYAIRFYFMEGFPAAMVDNGRLFDINIEGTIPPQFDNFDIYQEAGFQGNVPIEREFEVTVTDGNLDINFINIGTQNPAIRGIEIIPVTISSNPSDLATVNSSSVPVTEVNFGNVTMNTTSSPIILNLKNNGTTDPINVLSIQISGADSAMFSVNPTTSTTLDPAELYPLTLTFTPQSDESYSATLQITHDGDNGPLSTVTLIGNGLSANAPIYRVNAGGEEVTDVPTNWTEDFPTQIYSTAGGSSATGSPTVNTTGIPDEIFERERYGSSQWDFPVDSGFYTIHFYFMEGFPAAMVDNGRLFDINIEGTIPPQFDNIDIYEEAGFQGNVPIKREYQVEVTDGNLDINFINLGVQTPVIRGIEIYPANQAPTIDAIPDANVLENFNLLVDVNASDGDDDPITLSATVTRNSDSTVMGGSFYSFTDNANGTGSFTFTPTTGDANTYAVVVSASDGINPTVNEEFILTVTTNLPPVITAISDQSVMAGETLNVGVHSSDGDADPIILNVTVVRNSDSSVMNSAFYTFIDYGNSDGQITFTPALNAIGTYTVTVFADDEINPPSEETFLLTVTPSSLVRNALYRVNVGGVQLASADGSTPAWSVDTNANPSPYRTGGGSLYSTTTATAYPGPIIMTHPSLASATAAPQALFEIERWSSGPFSWAFPVTANEAIEVRLYFGELFSQIDQAGERVLDVSVEGIVPPVFDNVDQFAISGPKGAFMLSYVLIAPDSTLNIALTGVAQNPNLKGVEILIAESAPNTAPEVVNPGNQANNAGDLVSLPISVNDSEGDNITCTATGLPDGLSINSDCQITGTVNNTCSGLYQAGGGSLIEEGGLLIADLEFASPTDFWSVQSTAPGAINSTYYEWRSGNNTTNIDPAGTLGVLQYPIQITNPGIYRFQMRSNTPTGGEHNDVSVRFPNAQKAFGIRNGLPFPTTASSAQEGYRHLANNWFKSWQSSGINNWTWTTFNKDDDAHNTYVQFQSAGTYLMELSGRSSLFKIDRLVLWKSNVTQANALNINNLQSRSTGSPTCAYNVQVTATDDGSPNESTIINFDWTITQNNLAVTQVQLWNSSTDTYIRDLLPTDTINLATTPNFTVVAVTNPTLVGSVRFFLNGSLARNENGAPYSIAGDNNGDYSKWNLGLGQHTLVVSPYIAPNGGGSIGTSKTINLTVINQQTAPTITTIADQSVKETETLAVNVSSSDAENEPITLSATVTRIGDNAVMGSAFYSFTDNTNNTGVFNFTPAIGEAGTYTVTVTATDGFTTPSQKSFILTVIEFGIPEFDPIADVELYELASDTVTVSASNPSNGTIAYTPVGVLPGFVSWDDIDTFTIEPQIGDEGLYTITVEVSDGTHTAQTSFDITVVARTLTISSPAEGATIVGNSISLNWLSNVSDTNDQIRVMLDGEPYIGGQALSGSYVFTNVAPGAHVVSVEMADAADVAYPSINDSVNVTIVSNAAPVANAGNDATIVLPSNTYNLQGSISDPTSTGTLTALWTSSGPAPVVFGDATSPTSLATFSTAGIYTLTLTANDGELSGNDNVVIIVGPVIVKLELWNSASDTYIRDLALTDTINLVNTPNISVMAITSPATVGSVRFFLDDVLVRNENGAPYTIAGDNAGNLAKWNIGVGQYVLRATPSTNTNGNGIVGQSMSVNLTVLNNIPGNMAPIVQQLGTQTHSESDILGGGTLPGVQVVASDNENDPLAYNMSGQPSGLNIDLFTGLITGTIAADAADFSPYQVTISVFDSVNPQPTTMSFQWIIEEYNPPNGAPVVSAGNDASITLPTNTYNLQGSVIDATFTGTLTAEWSGPAGVVFTDANNPATTATFAGAGTYVLTLEGSDGEFTDSDSVTITVLPQVSGPSIVRLELWNATTDTFIRNLLSSDTINLALTPNISVVAITNPPTVGSVRFFLDSNLERNENTAPYSIAGVASGNINPWNIGIGNYQLSASAYDGQDGAGLSAGAMTIALQVVNNNTSNMSPIVPNQAFTVESGAFVSFDLQAGIFDPDGPGVVLVEIVDGPDHGTITGTAPNLTYTPNPSFIGDDIIIVAAQDGLGAVGQGTYTMIVRSTATNQPPVANAGADASITLPTNTYNLQGVVNDPTATGTLTALWTGPGGVTFANSANAVTTATFPSAGAYTLTLTANDGTFSHSDDVIITVNPPNEAPVANAGADASITLPNNSYGLQGSVSDLTPTGTLNASWSYSGPGTVTFTNNTSPITNASFSAQGIYTLTLSVTDGLLSHSDDVVISVNPAPTGQSIVALQLWNADTDTFIRNLNATDTINLTQTPSVSVVAVTNPGTVGSVRFFLDSVLARNENTGPYAIAGDTNGNYNPWNIAVGNYVLSATAYSDKNGGGVVGGSFIVQLAVIGS